MIRRTTVRTLYRTKGAHAKYDINGDDHGDLEDTENNEIKSWIFFVLSVHPLRGY